MQADSMPPLKPPVRAVRLSDQVAAQLQSLVVDQALKPGEKLPSERELCELLGVSRTVIREAVRALVVKGLLEVRPGGGMVVSSPDTALISELMSVRLRTDSGSVAFSHVHEIRRLLEVEIAGLAAERRTDADLRSMQEQLQAMTTYATNPQRWADADVAFHAAIAVATQNPLYPILLSSIVDLLTEIRLTGISLPGTAERAQKYHVPIYEHIQARDRAGARKAMLDHLRESETTFQKASFARLTRREAKE